MFSFSEQVFLRICNPRFHGKNRLYYQKVSEKWSPEEMLSTIFTGSIRICFSLCTRKWWKQSAMRSLMRRTGHWQSFEKMGKSFRCRHSKNIDGLHQKAGSRNVVELHDSTLPIPAKKCRKSSMIFRNSSPAQNPVPHIATGGSIIKPDMSEESLDINAIGDAV